MAINKHIKAYFDAVEEFNQNPTEANEQTLLEQAELAVVEHGFDGLLRITPVGSEVLKQLLGNRL